MFNNHLGMRRHVRTVKSPVAGIERRERSNRQLKHCVAGLEALEDRKLLAVATFQQGQAGYFGTQDTVLYSKAPNVNFGTETGISVDQQDVGGVRQGLLRFDGIFGASQIPLGSTINSAKLTFSVFNDSNAAMQMSFYRMKTDWSEGEETWNTFGDIGGVQASEGESEDLPPDGILFDAATGKKTFDITKSLRHWAAGEDNFGWLIESAATNGWDFNSSEAPPAEAPLLTVDFTPPSGAGKFEFLTLETHQAEGDAGTSIAKLQVARLGGVTGAASVEYKISAGTSQASDFVAATGKLDFAAGETTKTIEVMLNGDTLLEGEETVLVALSNPTNGASIAEGSGTATLIIGDDDALINEVLANVSDPTDKASREFIELSGTPGASLDGYFFVAFESEEEQNAGVADFVVNLTGQTFGNNGLLVITPTNWAYTADAATNVLATKALDGEGGVLENSSQTYALIRSPGAPLVQGTDYDTVGEYESNAQTAIGTGVGILDQLPSGAQIVDSVGVVEGGGGDRDRVATLAHPGVHVHQPDGFGDVASDAVSRRFGQKTPNTIGVWFNGDIPNGNVPVAYANGTSKISVTAPLGAQVTPGALNILRTVGFDSKAINVDEASGLASIKVTRAGDTTSVMKVDFAAVNGTAVVGEDFTLANGTLEFAAGVAERTIEIPITKDSLAEGFERLVVRLSNPSVPFLTTTSQTTVTIVDGNVLSKTFKNSDEAGGYQGTFDATLNAVQPNDPFGGTFNVSADEEAGSLLTGAAARPSQGLLWFNELFGEGENQVPLNSQIFGGFLTLNVTSPTAETSRVRFFRMLQSWDEDTTTWANPRGAEGAGIVNGVTPDGVESSAAADFILNDPAGAGRVEIPLNLETLKGWATGAIENFGWSIVNDSGDDWNFSTKDALNSDLAPELTILYNPPQGTGVIGFAESSVSIKEGESVELTLQRSGGSSGPLAVDYKLTQGETSAEDFVAAVGGSINFAAGELVKTISIPTKSDSNLERNETFSLTLTGAKVDAQAAKATVSIRDDDMNIANPALRLNELFINSPGNDGGREFAELAGQASAGMGSLLFSVIDGDVGPGQGSVDLIVDLGAYMNGSNGFTVVGAENTFDFNVPSTATFVGTPDLDTENIANDTATYALLYSPTTEMSTELFDYDWDNDGVLELPSGAVFIDTIAVRDDGIRDRTYGPGGNTIESTDNPTLFVADAISRKLGENALSSAAAWVQGDLVAEGDDPLVYDAANASGLPATGAALSPGEANTGSAAQSPLVALTSFVVDSVLSSVTLNFNGPISQVLSGGGLPGVFITTAAGDVDPRVDTNVIVTGVGTNTLTVQFSGASVVFGQLPLGDFRLNLRGTALVGNARAVDPANSGVPGSETFINLSQTLFAGDINGDRRVDINDFAILRANFNLQNALRNQGDLNGDGAVNISDFGILRSRFNTKA